MLPSLATQTQNHDDPRERSHLESVSQAFRQYAAFAVSARLGREHRIRQRIQNKDSSYKNVLPRSMTPGTDEWTEREGNMKDGEIRNQFFFDCMLNYAGLPNSQDVIKGKGASLGSEKTSTSEIEWSSDESMSKVSSVLKSLARDWSNDGKEERDAAYNPLLDAVTRFLPLTRRKNTEDGSLQTVEFPPRIVVPGAGVGRLALELSARGYEVQGNEFSLHMLLASDFMLNGGCSPQRQFEISPWILETRNVRKSDDPFRKVLIPDVDPFQMLTLPKKESKTMSVEHQPQENVKPPDFSMGAGDFVSVYSDPQEHSKWDGVVSCFFLDTAPCLVDYIQVIYGILKAGGLLINLGPLLFHWSGPPNRPDDVGFNSRHSHLDRRYMNSVDMTWQDAREVLVNVGFEILEERSDIPARYTADSRSLMITEYRCVYFVAKKK